MLQIIHFIIIMMVNIDEKSIFILFEYYEVLNIGLKVDKETFKEFIKILKSEIGHYFCILKLNIIN